MIKKEGTIEDLRISAKKCSAAGIEAIYSFIWGFPGETEEDFQKTVSLIQELWKMNHIKVNGFMMLNPYPGTPLYEVCIENGYVARKSLEEWIDFKWSREDEAKRLVWLDERFKKRAVFLGEIVRYVAYRNWLIEWNKGKKFGIKYLLINLWKLADLFLYNSFMYRIRTSNFRLPLDLKSWVFVRDRYIGGY